MITYKNSTVKPVHISKMLLIPLLLYTVASLFHFIHNGVYLDSYPNMPTWISQTGVYLTWLGIAAIGLTGYICLRSGLVLSGLSLLILYAILGLDGLAHYHLAPFSQHSAMMNLSILSEVFMATVVLLMTVYYLTRYMKCRVLK